MWLILVVGPPLYEALGLEAARLGLHLACVLVSLAVVLACRAAYRRLFPPWLPR